MGNIHFTEILDFVVGWAGFDLSKDDWLTRLVAEDRALDAGAQDLSKEPGGEPAKGADNAPPEEPAKKPPDEEKPPPPKAKPKDPAQKVGKHPLHELIP